MTRSWPSRPRIQNITTGEKLFCQKADGQNGMRLYPTFSAFSGFIPIFQPLSDLFQPFLQISLSKSTALVWTQTLLCKPTCSAQKLVQYKAKGFYVQCKVLQCVDQSCSALQQKLILCRVILFSKATHAGVHPGFLYSLWLFAKQEAVMQTVMPAHTMIHCAMPSTPCNGSQ